MPPNSRDKRNDNLQLSSSKKVYSAESSVAQWLQEIDNKISTRFPPMDVVEGKKYNNNSNIFHDETCDSNNLSVSSDKTLELVLADPQTGVFDDLHCASFDSHPNMAQTKDHDTVCCDCNSLKAPKWIDEVINEDICGSCLAKEEALMNSQTIEKSCCYRPIDIEQSIDLPDTNHLSHSTRKGTNNPEVKPDNNMFNSSPETGRIMNLIERAIGQLREVKVAVEENTVSSLTSDTCISTTSQLLSEIPSD